ncbi:MAG: elongation factor P hydroxylase [Flavobacterium sp.]|jgi:elongation factor P hydroxylase
MLNHIIDSFESEFKESYQTILVGGAEEPLYEPGSLHLDTGLSIVYFKEDYVSSALHEISHWCLAGTSRRKCVDYGYWYQSQRNDRDQSRFEEVEVLPQALEWILSVAVGIPFIVSADNLSLGGGDNEAFKIAVQKKATALLGEGLPKRISQIALLLSKGAVDHLDRSNYQKVPN